MTNRTLPPITGAPLDFVPIDAPVLPHNKTVFTAPIVKRAALAAIVAAAAIALIAFPTIGLVALALGVVTACVWAGGKLADKYEVGHDNH
ncbi:hypothetical protein [Rhizobium leucaenae]|uniref:hypothetical protein n=1 Tax=Rhizobium leucaenae TaxID=29450 RepID=UPI00048BF0FE|nr:hypothetical protein [Rhizobium leucaenae]